MGRHALRRGGLAAAVSSLVVAVAAASVVVLSEGGDTAQAAEAATTRITLSDPSSADPREDRPFVAGESGYLHRADGVAGLLWTDYATGDTVTVETADGVYTPGAGCAYLTSACRTAWYGSDSNLVALPSALSAPSVTLWDPATATSRAVTWSSSSEGYYRALAGDTIVTNNALIDFVEGAQRTRRLTGETTNILDNQVVAADSKGVLWARNGGIHYIDVDSAVSTEVFAGDADDYVLSADRVGWYDGSTGELHLKSRTDLTAPEQVVTLPYPDEINGEPVLVGDWLLLPSGFEVVALSLTDGSTRTLLSNAGEYALPAPGGALVTGGTGADDWWLQRVSEAEDGTPALEKLQQVPALEKAKRGLALSRGSLRVVDSGRYSTLRSLTTNGSTELTATAAVDSAQLSSKAVCPHKGSTTCIPLWGNTGAEPDDVYLSTFADVGLENADRITAIAGSDLEFGTGGGSIVDVSDDYAVYNAGSTQYVGEFGQGQQLKRSARAAALNGPTLWSATTTAGKLTSYSLTTRKTLATVTVPGLGCVPSELQAAGRWVYWACGSASAGVYDTKAGTAKAVAPGDVLLGDGFTVRHDHATGALVLTEAATGTTRVLASRLPDSGVALDRRYRWTVDEYTGLVAWFDLYERVQVTTTGITPSAVTAFDSAYADLVTPGMPYEADVELSRPVTSWSLTFTSLQSGANGRATRTFTGGASTDRVSLTWTGKAADGTYFPNGPVTWTLKAIGLGTTTANTVVSGNVFMERGSAVRHDFTSVDGPDGRGDLLTLNSSGGLTWHSGTGSGKFGEKLTGTGWPTTVKAIPFGDLSGDRCNDVLVRYSSGALRLYKPGCGAAVKPSTSYTTLATSGWTQYDVLTSPGDLSGDGRPDLLARNASTGTVYLHEGTSTGKLAARVKLYDNWKTYKKIVGVGDITGDGKADLLAQDKTNTLYRYNGKGDGTFASRVKVFSDWGASYNVVVGVGDIDDDGRSDLVSRDTGGNLYRNSGDGKGSFGSRVKIATGYSGYKSLS
ncbi:VCBS repeat-containing protein [Streptomyces sp. YS415]|uniref:FG-GAP repeat domain-containing protein n=1 Tax=Streptomyces sp. YS415 TaxID=2944806 RepID=UPI0020223998|nr:VCBS repeat-containing protein [Streptomyces sp. YS415]MCL7428906.1 VCBS repeat-containing protein [Streptomyces sp. YS415]